MKVYKLFCNTAADEVRRKFGDHYFISFTAAAVLMDQSLNKELQGFVDRVTQSTITREDDPVKGSRLVGRVKRSTLMEGTRWYKIETIETEDSYNDCLVARRIVEDERNKQYAR